jgi:hypothetical protein
MGEYRILDVPLTGQLITAEDAFNVGQNYRTLTNLRYTDTRLKGVGGMTKINSTALTTYLKGRDAYHLRKTQPAESHVLVQAYNAGETAAVIVENTTAIPNTGDFSSPAVFTETSGHGVGRFSDAPDGHVAYCNGKDTCVWAGTDMRVAQCVSFTEDFSTVRNFTEQVTTTLSGTTDVATLVTDTSGVVDRAFVYIGSLRPLSAITFTVGTANTTVKGGGTIDANTMLLLHGDGSDEGTTFTDSSPTTPHTVTPNGNVNTETSVKKFGTASAEFDGTGDYLSIPDNADFDLSGGEWSIDFWIRPTSTSGTQTIYYQETNASNYMTLTMENSGATYVKAQLEIVSGATVVLLTGPGSIKKNTWTHVEVTNSAGKYYVFINGQKKATKTDADLAANYTGSVFIGANASGASAFSGYLDEFRVSNVARHITDFAVESGPYGAVATTVTYWDGDSWAAVTNLVDGTETGSIVLGQSGTVSFDSTVGVAKPRVVNEVFLFWYRVVFNYIDVDTVTLSQVTVTAPFQPVQDLWDGATRQLGAALVQLSTGSTIKDYTVNLFDDAYDSQNEGTYATINAITSTGYLQVGFPEQMTALRITIVEDKPNTTADTVATVSYWDGTAFVAVSGLVDETEEGGIALAKSGTLSWAAPNHVTEFPKDNFGHENAVLHQVRGTPLPPRKKLQKDIPPLYFYRVTFTQTLTSTTRLSFIGGIPAQRPIRGYGFPVHAGNRLWLLSETDGAKHKAIQTAPLSVSVFNGTQVSDFFFGDDGPLIAGAGLLFASDQQERHLLLVCKRHETWAVVGQSPEDWVQYRLSTTIGCIAPRTMRVVNVPAGDYPGPLRPMAIWQGANGLYACDGTSIVPIHHQIRNLFEAGTYTAAQLTAASAFVDELRFEYHWCVGGAEWVFDYRRRKWFEVSRGTGKALTGGVAVADTSGRPFTYGLIETGYLERLENGTDFDGNAVVATLHFGELVPTGQLNLETHLRKVRLVGVAKTVTANSISGTYYGNSATSGTAFTLSPANTGFRLYTAQAELTDVAPALFHSLKFSLTTNDETNGFEPVHLALWYQVQKPAMT